MIYKRICFIVLWVVVLCAQSSFADNNKIYIIKISGSINPGVADFLKYGINKASDDLASCLIIELDTPGGLVESMREIVMAMFASKVPVAVYVSPGGARAASAGVMITMAADIAGMAPGTNIGAAHPVGLGGKEINTTISEKLVNDIVANAKSIAKQRGRNVDWVEKAVRQSVSVTETEALKENIIDVIAKDRDDFIQQINGRNVEGKGVLQLDNHEIIILKENIRTKILKTIGDPNIAYILLMIGLAGLYFELSHPGAIFPGVVGGMAIILACFAFHTLTVNYAGLLLIILAVIFFIMEMKIASYGLLSVAGVISLLLGSIMLFDGNTIESRISLHVLLPTFIVVSGFFVFISGLVFKSQRSQPQTGSMGLVGKTGIVKKEIVLEGKVFVHGELWHAVSEKPVKQGCRVRVLNVNDLVLEVEEI
jgi:membrane-bound serine protease (ClpP class)